MIWTGNELLLSIPLYNHNGRTTHTAGGMGQLSDISSSCSQPYIITDAPVQYRHNVLSFSRCLYRSYGHSQISVATENITNLLKRIFTATLIISAAQ
jgi:hypothetical protein